MSDIFFFFRLSFCVSVSSLNNQQKMSDGSVELFSFGLNTPVLETQPVCGGRRFARSFSKKDYPLLGEDDEDRVRKKNVKMEQVNRLLIRSVRSNVVH